MSKGHGRDALETRARKIVEQLGGTWSRPKGMCCCPAHADRTPSLSITLGKRAVLVHCFAGCNNDAVMQAMARLGVRISDLFDGPSGPIAVQPRVDVTDSNAFRLWLEASALAGTPAERYLAGRGISVSSSDLRYHPRMPLGPKGSVRFLPAMVAAVRNDAGVLALNRTFLDPDNDHLASFEQPKRSLGSPGSGAVRLAFPRGGRLGLAEGVESALSAMQLFGIPCWATLGNERFGLVTIPESVRALHLFVDNDAGGRLAEVFPYLPSRLAKVTYPWRLEQSHAMLIGTTGMGKTVALSDMIAEARARGQRAVIFDLTGAFIEHFYDSRRDVILNPLDARCPQWSVFDECRDEAEFTAAAEALVPHDGGGAEQFWVLAARLLFVEMCLKLRARGQASNEALAAELMTADLAAVHRLMRGTIADPLTAPEAARMAESIRAVFNANAKALKLLPKSGKRFSVRDWIENDQHDGGHVFISARYVDMSVCSQLLTVWLDLAMNTLMAMDRTREVRMWFFIDELGALHRLPALEKGLQTARNFGGAIVTGIHAYAKLKEVYGENMAMTLSSLARTKLILGTADRETATWCSDFIGHRQVRDMEEGYTYGYNNARDAVSLTSRKHIEPLLLPDQLMNLPRLSGYLKFPDGFPAAPVKLTPVDRARIAEPFIRRAEDTGSGAGPSLPQSPPSGPSPLPPAPSPAPRPSSGDGAADPPAANDDGAGQRMVPRQGELALPPGQEASSNEGEARQREPIGEVLQEARTADPVTSVPATKTPAAVNAELPEDGRNAPALPKDAALKLASGEGQEHGKSKDDQAPPRSDTPHVQKPASEPRAEQRQGVPSASVEARRLMLEDGLPEHDEPGRDERGLGEADMEI